MHRFTCKQHVNLYWILDSLHPEMKFDDNRIRFGKSNLNKFNPSN